MRYTKAAVVVEPQADGADAEKPVPTMRAMTVQLCDLVCSRAAQDALRVGRER